MSTFGLRADLELQAILSANASQVVVRYADDRLFREGDESDGVYLIKTGALRLSLEASPGKTVMNRTVGPGYVVGVPASINGHRYSLNCDVVEDAELAYISRSALTRLIQSDAGTAMKLLDLLSSEIQALRTALTCPLRRVRKGSSKNVRKRN